MDSKYNLKSIITGLLIIIAGFISIGLDLWWLKTESNIWISIGCSLLASGIVILATALLVDVKSKDLLDEWGIERIYKTRAEKSQDSDPKLEKANKQLDAVAFGLKSFRELQTKKVEKLLKKGVDIRILTMNPAEDNLFLHQREREENEPEGQIKKSIDGLVEWANKLNSKNFPGKVYVKGYKCMTLDFYWRVDNELYVGPYWYGRGSQQTITYRFSEGKRGFDIYADYFEELWENDNNVVDLTKSIGRMKHGKQRI